MLCTISNRYTYKILGLEWSILNDVCQVIELNRDADTDPIFISLKPGLSGIPEQLTDIGDSFASLREAGGWKITSLLQPKAEPGGVIKLESSVVNGVFKISSIRHAGDNYSAAWLSVMEIYER